MTDAEEREYSALNLEYSLNKEDPRANRRWRELKALMDERISAFKAGK